MSCVVTNILAEMEYSVTPQVDMVRIICPLILRIRLFRSEPEPTGDWTYRRSHGTGQSDANERFMKLMHPLLDL